MEQMGAVVDFYDERSIRRSYQKALIKISPKIFAYKTARYYRQIIEENKEKKYDYVFVIKCEMMSIQIIRQLKRIYPQAIFCLYLYDALKNIKGIQRKIAEFDRVFSFDSEDVKNNGKLIFRPLFFLDCYRKDIRENDHYKYAVSFIGSIHSDRYRIIKNVQSILEKKDLACYFYCYIQSRFVYFLYKITKSEFRNTKETDFEFAKIDSSLVAKVCDESKAVLDVQHPKQTGLTMRTIEMLGMNKKLITTNKGIVDYDFYDPNNILVVERDAVSIPDHFINQPYRVVDKAIYEKYSLEAWIRDILGNPDQPE
jgi:hypothetical protein